MSHSVSCGACNATFSIPDEVWEKRVEGQLATLKCRHCKAPIQIDGRTKRHANALVESKAIGDPKSVAIGATPSPKSNDETAPRATKLVSTEAAIIGKADAAKPPVSSAALFSSTRDPSKPKPVPLEHTKAEATTTVARPEVTATRSTKASAVTTAKAAEPHALSRQNAVPLRADVGSSKEEVHSPQKDGAVAKHASPRIEPSEVKSRPDSSTTREAGAKAADTVQPALAKKAALSPKGSTTIHELGASKPAELESAAVKRTEPADTNVEADHAADAAKPSRSASVADSPNIHPLAQKADSPEIDRIAEGDKNILLETRAGAQPAPASPLIAKSTTVSRGGGPPPLRKTAASTPDLGSVGVQQSKPKSHEPAGGERHGPPPLPRQASVHDAEPPRRQSDEIESKENAPRVHSPASMPVVNAMAIPAAAGRTPSLAPRPSDIAALVKIRPKFPKWLPFAVLGAAVLLVGALAALSWLRGDISAEKSVSSAAAPPPYVQSTVLPTLTQASPTPSSVNTAAPDTRRNANEFASQFAQAAAKLETTRFDREAADKALAPAYAKAASCHNKGDPVGAARITISIAPSGQILSVTLAPPFAGTFTADCIHNALMEAKSEPFQGAPGRLVHSISIR